MKLGRYVVWVLVPILVLGCGSDDDSADMGTGGMSQGAGGQATGGSLAHSGGSMAGADGMADITSVALGEEQDGVATYYDATGEGACLFDASPEDMDVAAINAEQWEVSAWCGACVDIQGPSGEVRVRLVDLCPECKTGHLDLSPQAFAKIAPIELGRVDITWQMVACDVNGPISYRYKDGANQWWTAVQVLNHRLPIESMEYSKDGSKWQLMQRMDYNYFLTEDGFGEGDTRVRVTASDGQTLTDILPVVQEYLVTEGIEQFR